MNKIDIYLEKGNQIIFQLIHGLIYIVEKKRNTQFTQVNRKKRTINYKKGKRQKKIPTDKNKVNKKT